MPADRIDIKTLLCGECRFRMEAIASRIEKGGVFIYPTETIYGIGGRYDDIDVFNKIISIKKRKPEKAIILLGADIESFAPLNLYFSPAAKKCAEKFWPGQLTMILPVCSSFEEIAVRVSGHPFIKALRDFFSLPIFSTSANISENPYQPDPDIIYKKFRNSVDFMVDAGFLPPSLPSTIVRFPIDGRITIVRKGAIADSDIFSVLNK